MPDLSFPQFISAYNTLYKETDQLYHKISSHFHLPDAAFWILYVLLEDEGGVSQRQLVSGLAMSKQTISSAMKGLEARGCIRLSNGRGRQKLIHLTDRGRELAEGTVRLARQMEERAFLGLTQEQCEGLLACNRSWLDLLRRESEVIFQTSQEE